MSEEQLKPCKWASRCFTVTSERQGTLLLLEKAPGQQWGEAVKHTGGQVKDGAETGLQGCGTTTVDHHHLVNLVRKLMGQERTERHTEQVQHKAGYQIKRADNPVVVIIFHKID